MKFSVELEDAHIKLLNALRDNWAKLGLGLDASEVMINLLTKAGISLKTAQEKMMLEKAEQIVHSNNAMKKAAKKVAKPVKDGCSCDTCKK